MTEKLFGTDGIRGTVNEGVIRPDMFLRLGEALGYVLKQAVDRPVVILGRDTRASGVILQSALEAGLLNAGVDIGRVGVVPTPALGWLTVQNDADAGIMITASHNPFTDNGVKIFGADGYKLSSAQQAEIEEIIQDQSINCAAPSDAFGCALEPGHDAEAYVKFASSVVGSDASFGGMKLCIDAANGAGFEVAAPAFKALGADVQMLNAEPDGVNINASCGALHPEALAKAVIERGADAGIAFDGDADRIVMIDETGRIVDGDQIMGAIAIDAHARGRLSGNTVVATIMSNLGLERALKERGIVLERTKVGDRYVVERLREGGFSVGGEQSGHVVLAEHVTTGDAIIAAMSVLSIMVRTKSRASDVLSVFEPVPQLLENVRYSSADPLANADVATCIERVRDQLGEGGRVVVRKSGTEPLIRVMAEAFVKEDAERAVRDIVDAIESEDAQ